jgi:hypothetical protein
MPSPSRDTMRPSCANPSPRKTEGAGKAGCPLHPQPRAQSVESTRVSHRRFTGTPGLPCAMVLTVYFALSPVTGLVCHRRPQETCKKLASRELDTSVGVSGPHDFAVRAQCHSSFDMPRPSHPAPNVRDDRETPLWRGRDGDGCRSDLGEKRTGIFLSEGLDRRTGDLPVGQFTHFDSSCDGLSMPSSGADAGASEVLARKPRRREQQRPHRAPRPRLHWRSNDHPRHDVRRGRNRPRPGH